MISLCMIVRNEAALLPRFLASVHGLWDELCVADTGSTDGSREILRQAGARIVDFPWIQDFAAARNASLALAGGDWIIYLDPDEFPGPALIAEIRALENDDQAGAATFLMRNLGERGEIDEQRLLRIFRRDDRISFEHPIHEVASASIATMLQARGLAIRHLAGHAEHIGYQPALMQDRNKRQRDQQILEACLTRNPADLYTGFKLLELANYWSDAGLAATTADHLRQQLCQQPPDTLGKRHWGANLLARLARNLYQSSPSQALQLLQGYPVTPTLDYLETRGLLFEATGNLAAAEADFNAALTLCRLEHAPEQIRVVSMLGLCRLALARGEFDQASALSDQALAINPRNLLALRYDLLLAQLAGGEPAILRRLDELRQRYGNGQELANLAPEFGLTAAVASGLAP